MLNSTHLMESPGTVVVLPLRGARGVGCAAVGSHATAEIAVASALIFAMRTTMVPATPLALAVAPLALAITMRLMMCIVVLFWSLPRSLSWLLHSMCGEVAALPLAVASLASASLALASLALALARACALALVRAALALATLLSRFAALAPSLVLVLFRGLVLVCAGGFR